MMNYFKLTKEHFEAIKRLQTIVYNSLTDKEFLETKTDEEYFIMLDQGYVIGLMDEGELIAMRGMVIPKINDPDHLADDVGLTSKERLIYSEISLVHPDYRGRGHQQKMGNVLIEMVKASGDFDYVLTTVMPRNLASLKDKFNLGFHIYRTKLKYGHKLRHVMMLTLNDHTVSSLQSIDIPYDNIDWMKDNNEHYIGVKFANNRITYIPKPQ